MPYDLSCEQGTRQMQMGNEQDDMTLSTYCAADGKMLVLWVSRSHFGKAGRAELLSIAV